MKPASIEKRLSAWSKNTDCAAPFDRVPIAWSAYCGARTPHSSLAADLSQLIAITRVLSATPGWKGRQRPIDSGVISSVLAKSLGNLQHQTPSPIGTGFALHPDGFLRVWFPRVRAVWWRNGERWTGLLMIPPSQIGLCQTLMVGTARCRWRRCQCELRRINVWVLQ